MHKPATFYKIPHTFQMRWIGNQGKVNSFVGRMVNSLMRHSQVIFHVTGSLFACCLGKKIKRHKQHAHTL